MTSTELVALSGLNPLGSKLEPSEMVGVGVTLRDDVGVTVEVGDCLDLVGVGVLDAVGVLVRVFDTVGVLDGVLDGVGVLVGVVVRLAV